MKALKSLPTLQNWQDFETLYKKLWGEISECREIKKWSTRPGSNWCIYMVSQIESQDTQE